MALILIMDSTTTICYISLIYKNLLLKNITYSPSKINTINFMHINIIHLIIRKIFKCCKLSIISLKALAFNFGPGSYTSIKIGLAAALGLVYGLNIKLIDFNYPECVNFTNNSIILIKDNLTKRKKSYNSCIIKKKLFINLKQQLLYKILKSKIIKQIYLFSSKINKVKYNKKYNNKYNNINKIKILKLNPKLYIYKIYLKIKTNINNKNTIFIKYIFA
ncbi:hypothetical protein [Candidatus Karelsulcia muelleri]